MGTPAPIHYTADVVRALPDDGQRHELVCRELLVTPAPRRAARGLMRTSGPARDQACRSRYSSRYSRKRSVACQVASHAERSGPSSG